MQLESIGNEQQLLRLKRIKHGPDPGIGWSTALTMRFGHFTPDDYYESCIESLVSPETDWIDVGGGHAIFPSNPRLARILADRCRRLVAVDPSANVHENPYAHELHKSLLEDFMNREGFSLATMRMVVEHVVQPKAFVSKLGELLRPGGKAVVYTVDRWAPVTAFSAMTPLWFHHAAKRVLWQTDERDTFPVAYLMNTRSRLRGLFGSGGFREVYFRHLDDCRTLARWKIALTAELTAWKLLNNLGLHYPETCLLGVYERL
jgi:SAM-dependent methyltransferase